MAATKKLPRTILLTPEQADALKRLSDETEIPQQALMRRGIDLVLAEHAEQAKRWRR